MRRISSCGRRGRCVVAVVAATCGVTGSSAHGESPRSLGVTTAYFDDSRVPVRLDLYRGVHDIERRTLCPSVIVLDSAGVRQPVGVLAGRSFRFSVSPASGCIARVVLSVENPYEIRIEPDARTYKPDAVAHVQVQVLRGGKPAVGAEVGFGAVSQEGISSAPADVSSPL